MTVKQLINLLKKLEHQDWQIDIAGDDEGNNFGDIDSAVSEGELLEGGMSYTLYPIDSKTPDEKYKF